MLLRLSRAVGVYALAAAPALVHSHAARHDTAPPALPCGGPLLSRPRPALCVEETSRAAAGSPGPDERRTRDAHCAHLVYTCATANERRTRDATRDAGCVHCVHSVKSATRDADFK